MNHQSEKSKIMNKIDQTYDDIEGSKGKKEKLTSKIEDSENSYCEEDTKNDRYKFLEAEKPDIEDKINLESDSKLSGNLTEEHYQSFDDNASNKSEKSNRSVDRKSESSCKSNKGVKDRKREQSMKISPRPSKQREEMDRSSPPPVVKQSGKPTHSKNVDHAIGSVCLIYIMIIPIVHVTFNLIGKHHEYQNIYFCIKACGILMPSETK